MVPCLSFCVNQQETSPNKAHTAFVFYRQLLVLTSAHPFSSTVRATDDSFPVPLSVSSLRAAVLIDLRAEVKLFNVAL